MQKITSSALKEIRTQGWGFDEKNTRFIPKDVADLSPEDLPRLKLKRAFETKGAE